MAYSPSVAFTSPSRYTPSTLSAFICPVPSCSPATEPGLRKITARSALSRISPVRSAGSRAMMSTCEPPVTTTTSCSRSMVTSRPAKITTSPPRVAAGSCEASVTVPANVPSALAGSGPEPRTMSGGSGGGCGRSTLGLVPRLAGPAAIDRRCSASRASPGETTDRPAACSWTTGDCRRTSPRRLAVTSTLAPATPTPAPRVGSATIGNHMATCVISPPALGMRLIQISASRAMKL